MCLIAENVDNAKLKVPNKYKVAIWAQSDKVLVTIRQVSNEKQRE